MVTVGLQSVSNLQFEFTNGSATAPVITHLTPTSANHGVKGTMEISGDNFGTDSSKITVFLSNATGKIYQLPVLEIASMNNTYLKVGLPGGRQGVFTV